MINLKGCFGGCICLEVVIQVILMLGSNSTLGKELMWTVLYSNIYSDTALWEKANIQLFCQLLFQLHLLNWQDAWI